MVWDGDIECVKKLIKPAEEVIKRGLAISRETHIKRLELWNMITENYEKYTMGECGEFLEDLDREYRSTFEIALLILEICFEKDREGWEEKYNEKEKEAYKKISKYNVFEISDIHDIKRKIINRDQNLLDLFKEYYIELGEGIERIVEDSEIGLEIRYYLKKKWEEYKKKIDEAITQLGKELDWFRRVVKEWEKEKEEREKLVREEIAQKEAEIEKEKKTIQEEIEKLRKEKEKGKDSRLVKLEEAKFYENNFVGRIKNKLQGEIEINGKRFKVEKISEGSMENIYKYADKLDKKDLENLPENRYIIGELVEKKLLGKPDRITLKTIFCSRVEKLAQFKFDTDPLELADINKYFSEELDNRREGKAILCIASPTGFTEDVEKHVSSEEFHQNILANFSVCLVDMAKGKLLFNPYDELIKKFKKICVLETNEELLAKTEKCVEKIVLEKGSISLKEAEKKCGEREKVKMVFYRLEDKGGYIVKYLKDIKDLVLIRWKHV